jgi:hypothetical protein
LTRCRYFAPAFAKALTQIVPGHRRHDLNFGVVVDEERLDHLNDLRRLGKIEEQHAAAFAVRRPEISGLQFQLRHDRFHHFAKRSVLERLVSFFDRKTKFQHHSHDVFQYSSEKPVTSACRMALI